MEPRSGRVRLALGTAQLGMRYGIGNSGQRVSADEARRIVEAARVSGMALLDTAIAYGDSEFRLGHIGIGQWQVVTKLPFIPELGDDTTAWVLGQLRDSLRRLRVDRLYGLLLHRPAQLLARNGPHVYRALMNAKEEGLVRKIGVSIYDPEELAALAACGPFDLVQAPLNVMDRRLATSGWLARSLECGTEVHVRSVFLQGLLLMPPDGLPAEFRQWRSLWSSWHQWVDDSGQTPVEACVRHAMSFPGVSRIVVGVDSESQLTEVLAAASGSASPVPEHLQCFDPELVNPARWPRLLPAADSARS